MDLWWGGCSHHIIIWKLFENEYSYFPPSLSHLIGAHVACASPFRDVKFKWRCRKPFDGSSFVRRHLSVCLELVLACISLPVNTVTQKSPLCAQWSYYSDCNFSVSAKTLFRVHASDWKQNICALKKKKKKFNVMILRETLAVETI